MLWCYRQLLCGWCWSCSCWLLEVQRRQQQQQESSVMPRDISQAAVLEQQNAAAQDEGGIAGWQQLLA
jgi:hypothetical protein